MKVAWKRLTVVLGVGLLTACASLQPPGGDVEEPQNRHSETFRQPRLSVSAAEAINLESAYAAQKNSVITALGSHAPSGFKAGLTSVAAHQRFKLREPIAGVLWPDSAIAFDGEEAVIKRGAYRKPMLEVEMAFRVGTLIPEPLADVSEVLQVVTEIMPALELPDLGFDSEVGLTGEAVVAANAGARYYVLGAPVSPESVDVNAVRVTLHRDGQFVQRGEATQVMGNQWRALFWLINTMVEQGWVIQPGQVLLTGAMGDMVPLETGVYEARFSELGDIRLRAD